MENIIAILFTLGEVALYIYLLIALCSYRIALSALFALSCIQSASSANSAMSFALQLPQKFHVTKLTKLTKMTRTWSKWSIWSCKTTIIKRSGVLFQAVFRRPCFVLRAGI